MKVKIIKCSDPDWWYSHKIGEEYEVEWSESLSRYRTVNPLVDKAHGYISKEDFCIIPNEPTQTISESK